VLARDSDTAVRADGSPPARRHGTTGQVRAADDDRASLPSGDRVQVFAPGDPYFEFFSKQADGPVALFEVDDVHAAHAELIAAEIKVIGPIEQDKEWEWLHFRGPDGNLYELASRRTDA
jgi:hypothetical protein